MQGTHTQTHTCMHARTDSHARTHTHTQTWVIYIKIGKVTYSFANEKENKMLKEDTHTQDSRKVIDLHSHIHCVTQKTKKKR